MPKKTMWVCSECGSTNVQTKMWVYLNTNEPDSEVSDGEAQDNWCCDCGTHCDISQDEVDS